MSKGVIVVNGSHPEGNCFVAFGPVTMEGVRDLIGGMMMAKRKWEEEGRPNSGDFA